MTSVPLPRLKSLSILITLLLVLSAVFVVPANATPKARRTAGRSKSIRARVKGRSRSSHAGARRGGRSTRPNARYSRRGGQLYATRDRRGRLRWHRRVVSTSVHGLGVHNFLSESWTQPLGAG